MSYTILKKTVNVRNIVIATGAATGGFLLFQNLKKRNKMYARKSSQKVPRRLSLNIDESDLELRQVQVLFRHGARTPLHTIPKLHQAEYKPEFIMKEHQASLFPYKCVSMTTGKPTKWGKYQNIHDKISLKGGVCPGALTTFGMEQMYCLGRRLQSAYGDRLGLDSYDPHSVYVLSTNIRRTVGSARGVLAGFFGTQNLTDYAHKTNSPIKLNVIDDRNNILIPDTGNCPLLRKVNQSVMKHPDNIGHMKKDRLKVEGHIESIRQSYISSVDEIQQKINKLHSGAAGYNKLAQDAQAQKLLNERNRATENIAQFWSDVICRHPELGQKVSKDDMKSLVYLSHIDVERMTGYQPGYRYKFHFESNPYFKNNVLIKEVYDSDQNLKTSPSWSTPVNWKPFGSLLPGRKNADLTPSEWLVYQRDEEERKVLHIHGDSEKEESLPEGLSLMSASLQNTGVEKLSYDPQEPNSQSFFSWFTQLVSEEKDDIGRLIRDILLDPLPYLKLEPSDREFQHKNINFIFARDDLAAREAHGLPTPPALRECRDLIEQNATDLMLYAMTGQTREDRKLVSQLAVGQLLNTFLYQAKQELKKKKEAHKLVMYSSHDSTMVALLEAMGIWDHTWPPFASDLRIELYQLTGSSEYFVKVLYNGQAQKLRNQDSELISWYDFKSALKPYTIKLEDFKKSCHVAFLQQMPKSFGESDKEPMEPKTVSGRGPRSAIPAGM